MKYKNNIPAVIYTIFRALKISSGLKNNIVVDIKIKEIKPKSTLYIADKFNLFKFKNNVGRKADVFINGMNNANCRNNI